MKVSVIIPALNEEARLRSAIESVGKGPEIIVADGQSLDSTRSLALSLGARVVSSKPGRGAQMDAGAAAAAGDILLFLHADSTLPEGWLGKVRAALSDPDTVAGGFGLRIGSEKKVFRLIELAARARFRVFGLIYGDQAIFVRKDVFVPCGGFRKLPLMEDVDCVKRLRNFGRLALIGDSVTTSSRRWDRGGVLKVTLRNLLYLFLFSIGVSPRRLYGWYYDKD